MTQTNRATPNDLGGNSAKPTRCTCAPVRTNQPVLGALFIATKTDEYITGNMEYSCMLRVMMKIFQCVKCVSTERKFANCYNNIMLVSVTELTWTIYRNDIVWSAVYSAKAKLFLRTNTYQENVFHGGQHYWEKLLPSWQTNPFEGDGI